MSNETIPDEAPNHPDPAADAQVDAEPALETETEVVAEVVAEGGAETETVLAAAAPAVPELSPAAVAARLAELFPALFTPGQAKPLKLRIQADIQQRAPGLFTKKSLSMFLHRLTMSTPYLMALTKAPSRFDLDGAAAGELAAEHREAATTELARRRGLHEARRAAENAARREAEAQARQAHAAEHDARRERAGLLRAFETSTLTRANFCALKGISETDLEAALGLARVEREQRPPEPLREIRHERHEPRQDRHDRRPPDQRPRGGGPAEQRPDRRPGRPRPPNRPAPR